MQSRNHPLDLSSLDPAGEGPEALPWSPLSGQAVFGNQHMCALAGVEQGGHDDSMIDEIAALLGEDLSDVQIERGRGHALGAEGAATDERVSFAAAHPGRETVAHELAHVVQLRRSGSTEPARETTAPHDPAEREADQVAAQVARGQPAAVSQKATGKVGFRRRRHQGHAPDTRHKQAMENKALFGGSLAAGAGALGDERRKSIGDWVTQLTKDHPRISGALSIAKDINTAWSVFQDTKLLGTGLLNARRTGDWSKVNNEAWRTTGKWGGSAIGGSLAGPPGAFVGGLVGEWAGSKATPETTHGALAGQLLFGPGGAVGGAALGTLIGERGEAWMKNRAHHLGKGAKAVGRGVRNGARSGVRKIGKGVKKVGKGVKKVGKKLKKAFGF